MVLMDLEVVVSSMWFRTDNNDLINLDSVSRIRKYELCDIYMIFFKNGDRIEISESDRKDVERLLMKNHVLKYKELTKNVRQD